jgi:PKD repeat protein
MNSSGRISHWFHVPTLVAVAVALAFLGCDKGGPTSQDDAPNNTIQAGSYVEAARGRIGSAGGSFRVDKPGSPIDGLTITLDPGTYPSEKEFIVSYAAINSHSLGDAFSPVSPLIRIENGGAYASRMMTVHVPIHRDSGSIAAAYYYDEKTGDLDAIPVAGSGNDYIDIAVMHFSAFVVTQVQKQTLMRNGGFTTFFDPAVNGWSFYNEGTYPSTTGGICAGMSIGAAYLYRGMHSSLHLRTYFDNDQLWFRTPDIWQDDATALKFATEVHMDFAAAGWDDTKLRPVINGWASDQFWSACYGLRLLNQPQMLYLDNPDNMQAGSHAVLVFGYTLNQQGGTLRVYDPNYMGLEGTISFDFSTNKFLPYQSANNAKALERGDTYYYTRILFIPITSLGNMQQLDAIWRKVADHTIGNNLFPAFQLYAVKKNDPGAAKVLLQDASGGKTTMLPFEDFDVEIVPAGGNGDFRLASYEMLDGTSVRVHDPIGPLHLEYATNNLIGISVFGKPAGSSLYWWAGYRWLKINKQLFWIEPQDTIVAVNTSVRFTARHNGTAPGAAQWEWDFGDGSGVQKVSGDSTVVHTFTSEGAHAITLTLKNGSTGVKLGEATTTVTVVRWTSIAITLVGMDYGDPSSTIKDDKGKDIPSISWGNKMSTVTQLLRWNGDNFSTDFSYSISPADYTGHVEGRLSPDRTSVLSLAASINGTISGGGWQYNSTVAIAGFPLSSVGSDILGSQLAAEQAHGKISSVTWEQQNGTETIRLGSVNWGSPKTRLSVYFYVK